MRSNWVITQYSVLPLLTSDSCSFFSSQRCYVTILWETKCMTGHTEKHHLFCAAALCTQMSTLNRHREHIYQLLWNDYNKTGSQSNVSYENCLWHPLVAMAKNDNGSHARGLFFFKHCQFYQSPLSLSNGLLWCRWGAVERDYVSCCGRGINRCDSLITWVSQSLGWTTGVRLSIRANVCICWYKSKNKSSINKLPEQNNIS